MASKIQSKKFNLKRLIAKLYSVFFFISALMGSYVDLNYLKPKIKAFIKTIFNTDDYDTVIYIVITTALFLLIFSIIWLLFDSKRTDAGIRGVACSTKSYLNFKFYNKSKSLIDKIHTHMYHEIFITIKKIKKDKKDNSNLIYQNYCDDITKILKYFQYDLRETFGLDLNIILYLMGQENDNDLLKRWIFINNLKDPSEQRAEEEDKEPRNTRYIIRNSNCKTLKGYANNAKNCQEQNLNGNYWTNSIFDYLITATDNYFISNDLENDEKNNEFYTTNVYYNKDDDNRVRSLAAFAVIPPPSEDRRKSLVTKGILTFDSKETKVFTLDECKMLMGLMAHYIYEILYEINN